jgi:hypothetical protein
VTPFKSPVDQIVNHRGGASADIDEARFLAHTRAFNQFQRRLQVLLVPLKPLWGAGRIRFLPVRFFVHIQEVKPSEVRTMASA